MHLRKQLDEYKAQVVVLQQEATEIARVRLSEREELDRLELEVTRLKGLLPRYGDEKHARGGPLPQESRTDAAPAELDMCVIGFVFINLLDGSLRLLFIIIMFIVPESIYR